MEVLIIDGQGGRIGRQLCEAVTERYPHISLTAVGTNSMATAAMLKGGAKNAATGENAVKVACRKADVIIGPLGIVIADSLLGEVTPEMAAAVGQSNAQLLLIPVNRCSHTVVGCGEKSLSALIDEAVERLGGMVKA